MDDHIPQPHDLKKKPLAEAIFEIRWTIQSKSPGVTHDPGFPILVGRYYDRMRNQYQYAQELPASQAPEEMTGYVVRYQFRVAKDQWPVTQLGPGVLTVNETQGYRWRDFRPRVLESIKALFESYPNDFGPLSPVAAHLRYVNAVPYNPDEKKPIDILRDSLHTKIEVDELLFNNPLPADQPQGVNLKLTLPLRHLPGVGSLIFSTGASNGKPAIIWDIHIQSSGDQVPKEPEKFEDWLTNAHAVVDKWFFALSRGDLLDSFE